MDYKHSLCDAIVSDRPYSSRFDPVKDYIGLSAIAAFAGDILTFGEKKAPFIIAPVLAATAWKLYRERKIALIHDDPTGDLLHINSRYGTGFVRSNDQEVKHLGRSVFLPDVHNCDKAYFEVDDGELVAVHIPANSQYSFLPNSNVWQANLGRGNRCILRADAQIAPHLHFRRTFSLGGYVVGRKVGSFLHAHYLPSMTLDEDNDDDNWRGGKRFKEFLEELLEQLSPPAEPAIVPIPIPVRR